ncbi:MAG TPA: Mrp/NBP35 family ATP-binding protein [Candidatus Limnocylindria bacterium]|nr:Mrp/NBP35 family ATP-binding protein [Candidatus Limnocylindria bacterium]
MTQDAVLAALRTVKYPGYSRDIVSFGLVKDIQIDGNAVGVLVELTTPNPELGQQIADQIRATLRNAFPDLSDAHVQVKVPTPQQAAATPGGVSQKQRLPGIRRVIAIASGKGGVGKSTCSVNLACALQQLGARVGLLDADIYGPSIPLMMGIHQKPNVTEDDHLMPIDSHGVKLMSIGFLIDPEQAVIWRGPMIQKTIQQFVNQVAWGELDYLLVDLPPGTGDAQLSLCQTVPLDGGVVVTTPQEASLGVVRKGITMFEKVQVPLLGIVENMSYFTAPDGSRVELFGHGGGRAEATRKNIPFLGEVPLFVAIREGGDSGIPITVSQPNSAPAQAFMNVAKALQAVLG